VISRETSEKKPLGDFAAVTPFLLKDSTSKNEEPSEGVVKLRRQKTNENCKFQNRLLFTKAATTPEMEFQHGTENFTQNLKFQRSEMPPALATHLLKQSSSYNQNEEETSDKKEIEYD